MSEFDYYLNGWFILGGAAFGVLLIAAVAVIIDMILNKPKKPHILTIEEMNEKLQKNDVDETLYNKIATTFLTYYSKLPPKKEAQTNKDSGKQMENILKFIGLFADHHESSEETLLNLQKTLIEQNPEYKEEITQHINKSLKNKK